MGNCRNKPTARHCRAVDLHKRSQEAVVNKGFSHLASPIEPTNLRNVRRGRIAKTNPFVRPRRRGPTLGLVNLEMPETTKQSHCPGAGVRHSCVPYLHKRTHRVLEPKGFFSIRSAKQSHRKFESLRYLRATARTRVAVDYINEATEWLKNKGSFVLAFEESNPKSGVDPVSWIEGS